MGQVKRPRAEMTPKVIGGTLTTIMPPAFNRTIGEAGTMEPQGKGAMSKRFAGEKKIMGRGSSKGSGVKQITLRDKDTGRRYGGLVKDGIPQFDKPDFVSDESFFRAFPKMKPDELGRTAEEINRYEQSLPQNMGTTGENQNRNMLFQMSKEIMRNKDKFRRGSKRNMSDRSRRMRDKSRRTMGR
tara:strand:+ start:1715 stop:2269 length:555 start_codon:yes stop_codon:yes gene_type:complete